MPLKEAGPRAPPGSCSPRHRAGTLYWYLFPSAPRKLVPERLDQGYTGHYAWMDPGTLYVKIDDDVVYVADHAIDHMLQAHNLVGVT